MFNNTVGLGREFAHGTTSDTVLYKDLPVRSKSIHNLLQPVASYLYDPILGLCSAMIPPSLTVDELGGSCKLDRSEIKLDYPASAYLNIGE